MKRFIQANPVVDSAGRPTNEALKAWNEDFAQLQGFITQYALETSYPDGFTPPLIEADDLGNVTIASHTRYYGDGTFVAVDGGVIATGEANPSVVRVFYDDMRRAGGAVAYQFTVDPAPGPVQAGSRHVVGKVEIPVAGTQAGTYLHPPGYLA